MRRRQRDTLDYFAFEPGKWLGSPAVNAMTPAQRGAYIHLLAIEGNSKDCTLPNDEAMLAAMSGLGSDWSTLGTLVRAQFSVHPKDSTRLINKKLYSKWRASWSAFRARCKRNRENRLKRSPVVDHSLDQSSTIGAVKQKQKRKQRQKQAIEAPVEKYSPAPASPAAEMDAQVPTVTTRAVNWSSDAADDFRAVYGGPPPDQFFAQVKPVAKKYGWARTRPALLAYMEATRLEYLAIPKCLAVWVENGNGDRNANAPGRRRTASEATVAAVMSVVSQEKGGQEA